MPGRNSGFLLIITGWGASGKVILQVGIAVFLGRCQKKIFVQRWLSPPLEKIGRTPMVGGNNHRQSVSHSVAG